MRTRDYGFCLREVIAVHDCASQLTEQRRLLNNLESLMYAKRATVHVSNRCDRIEERDAAKGERQQASAAAAGETGFALFRR